MKLALLSDLHLSVEPMPFPDVDADVLVLAGDLARPARAMAWASATRLPTLYVAGNHEFYGSDLVSTYALLREHAAGTSIRVLERSEWHHRGVRFLGCTLWSDYRLFDSPDARTRALELLMRGAYDFSRIRVAPDYPELFTPSISQMLFEQSVAWLEECFARPHDGPTVVVTHFAPSRGSIAARFADSPINAAFVSDLDAHIARWRPVLWLHGHTHDSFDYRIGSTRVVCNSRGYARGGAIENARFDPSLTVEVPLA
ncbi:MAG TPA: metallophosphoesterase [Nevskiaceae bacterium]|nr:metallophosphoesterase [Nevskiaceae bacterium]